MEINHNSPTQLEKERKAAEELEAKNVLERRRLERLQRDQYMRPRHAPRLPLATQKASKPKARAQHMVKIQSQQPSDQHHDHQRRQDYRSMRAPSSPMSKPVCVVSADVMTRILT